MAALRPPSLALVGRHIWWRKSSRRRPSRLKTPVGRCAALCALCNGALCLLRCRWPWAPRVIQQLPLEPIVKVVLPSLGILGELWAGHESYR